MAIFATPGGFVPYLGKMFGGAPLMSAETGYYLRSFLPTFLALILAATPLPKRIFARLPEGVRNAAGSVLMVLGLAASTVFLVAGSYNPFLYFRF